MKKGLLVLAACALASSASAATTDNPFAQDKATLRLEGLDLSTADGQQRLDIRLDQAARAVCGDRLATVHLALGERSRQCQAEVIADVRAQIDARLAKAAGNAQVQLASNR
ncbi:MAG: UrcA family protein [Candidatus Andeanibacterium colombiense]|uniref:UrcA family protein n=1 Tax=Candidatus Andeanibacterium colombiense TaxID=3121345 RepID=A0AAJ5X6C9_9SPHN|nr:MAG: UrcA family protein [Sphingomonadaceae bacterium]